MKATVGFLSFFKPSYMLCGQLHTKGALAPSLLAALAHVTSLPAYRPPPKAKSLQQTGAYNVEHAKGFNQYPHIGGGGGGEGGAN